MTDPMTSTSDRVEIITSVQRRRRWTAAEKMRLVEATFAPGMTVSLVARQNGVNPNQLFTWRRLAAQQERDPDEAFAAILSEPDLTNPQQDRPKPEHQPSHAPRPEDQRQDRSAYEQDRGRQPQHSRTRWVSRRHRSPGMMPPILARSELRGTVPAIAGATRALRPSGRTRALPRQHLLRQ